METIHDAFGGATAASVACQRTQIDAVLMTCPRQPTARFLSRAFSLTTRNSNISMGGNDQMRVSLDVGMKVRATAVAVAMMTTTTTTTITTTTVVMAMKKARMWSDH